MASDPFGSFWLLRPLEPGPVGNLVKAFCAWIAPFEGDPKTGFLRTRKMVQDSHLGVGQNQTTRGPQVVVQASIYQGSIFGYLFLTHSHLFYISCAAMV